MFILGLSGYARSGKDTFADLLVEEFEFQKTAYADRLREALYTLNPTVIANREHHGMLPSDYFGPVYRTLQSVIDEYGWEGYKTSPFSLDVRRLIQVMGTEVGRGIAGEDVWVMATFRGLDLTKNTVIADVRFPNEAQAIKDNGGYIIHIERPGVGPVTNHPSETSLEKWPFDFHVQNNAHSVEEYHEHIRAFMGYLGEHEYFKNVIGDM